MKGRKILSKSISLIAVIMLLASVLVLPDEAYAASKTHLKKTSVTVTYGTVYQQKLINKSGKVIKSTAVTWKSKDTSIAKINKYGKVTTVKVGTAKMTAKYKGKTYSFTVNVKNPTLRAKTKTLKCGATYTQKLLKSNKTAIDPSKITFSSSNTKVAYVNKKGVVKGKRPGTAVITLKYKGKTFKSTFTVKSRVALNKTKCTFNDSKVQKITITVDDAVESVTYEIDNEDIVSCKWGKWKGNSIPLSVTPLDVGETKIKITYEGKGSAYDSKTIKVLVQPVKIILPKTPISITEYTYSGGIRNICKVTNVYYTVEKSGSEYYYEIYIDGQKTYGSSTTASSCEIGYQLLEDGVVVDSGSVYSSDIFLNQKFKGTYFNGFISEGEYELKLMDVI